MLDHTPTQASHLFRWQHVCPFQGRLGTGALRCTGAGRCVRIAMGQQMRVLVQKRFFSRWRKAYFPEPFVEREWKLLFNRCGNNAESLEVFHAVNSGPRTNASGFHVCADHLYQARVIAKLLAICPNLFLGGAYHSHPPGCFKPSGKDREIALDFVLERRGISGWGLDQFLVLIGTELHGEFKTKGYVISKDHQEFVEVPIEITENKIMRI